MPKTKAQQIATTIHETVALVICPPNLLKQENGQVRVFKVLPEQV